jgi:hypothetical protein
MLKIIALAALTLANAASAQTSAPTPRTERWSIEIRDVPNAEARRGITPRSGRLMESVELRGAGNDVSMASGDMTPYVDVAGTTAPGAVDDDGLRHATTKTLFTGTKVTITRRDGRAQLDASETRLVRWTSATIGDEAFVTPHVIEASVTLPLFEDGAAHVVGGYERPSVSSRPGIQRIFIVRRIAA